MDSLVAWDPGPYSGQKVKKKKKTIGEQREPNVLLRFCYFSPQQSLVSG